MAFEGKSRKKYIRKAACSRYNMELVKCFMRERRSSRSCGVYRALCAALVACLCVTACSKRNKVKLQAPKAVPQYTETGIASWYGHPYHGRRAANGEIYDMEKMTAAHRTLPFNTVVRVTNLTNAKTVDVRITDRGPFVDGRIIDLSHAAARQLDMIGPGIVRVKITSTGMQAPAESGSFGVQVGAFRDKRNAERVKKELEQSYSPVEMALREGNVKIWRVVVGRKPSEPEAQALADDLAKTRDGVFVIRLD